MTHEQVVEALDQLQALFNNTKQELKELGLLKESIKQEGWGFGNKTFPA